MSEELGRWIDSDGDKTLSGLIAVFGKESFAVRTDHRTTQDGQGLAPDTPFERIRTGRPIEWSPRDSQSARR